MQIPEGYEAIDDIPEGYEPVQDDMSFGDVAGGLGNIAVASGVGLGKQALEGLSGLGSLMLGKDVDQSISGARAMTSAIPDVELGDNAQNIISTLSEKYQAAPEIIKDIVSSFANLGENLGEKTFQATGSPALSTAARMLPDTMQAAIGAKAITSVPAASVIDTIGNSAGTVAETTKGLLTYQSPQKQNIGRMLEAGSTDIDTARFKLKSDKKSNRENQRTKTQRVLDIGGPKIKADKPAQEAIRQGFSEGFIATVKKLSSEDKKLMRRQVTIMEKGKKNSRFATFNRPSDVAGDSLMKRFKIIQRANKESGRNIDNVAKSLKGKPVDLSAAASKFSQNLEELGVVLVDDGKGGFKPDFNVSQLGPGDRGPLKEVIRQMNIQGAGGIDGLTAHRMKRIIDNNVTFGRVKTGMSGDAERALKDFRKDIDATLDENFPAYDRLNKVYSETITYLNAFQDAAGKKMDLTGDNSDKATGTLLRRILSEAQSRIPLLDSIEGIEKTAKKYENFRAKIEPMAIEGTSHSSITDDLFSQILFADELDSVFGPVARTSFQGQIKKAVKGAASAYVRPADTALNAAASTAEKVRGINEGNAFKAIKRLLE